MNPACRCVALLAGIAWFNAASAHVPFIEAEDYTADGPFVVEDVEQSKALYGWLAQGDVDYFAMPVEPGAPLYVATLVPECVEYRDFRVTFALTGPGLPAPMRPLPFRLAAGEGAIVMEDRSTPRTTTYEMFSARSYYQGPELERPADRAGTYRLIVWNDGGLTGDYVAVIGQAERFDAEDFARAARNTPTIRDGGELKGACTPGAAEQ